MFLLGVAAFFGGYRLGEWMRGDQARLAGQVMEEPLLKLPPPRCWRVGVDSTS